MTSPHIIKPEANTPIAASDGQNPYFFIIDTSGRSKREIKHVFSEFFNAFEIFLHSGHKIKLESDSSKVDKDSIETKETHTTAQPAAQIR
ncbi:hypothetical protein JZM24_07165 [Candidatus Sodalis endolongispinus]|uniref:Uncharacterized protein n=1 Tax=Candidatus Sodalis endolongispinus TaxID=2812662 RepID=A0ABS5YBI0_9GAMM|nr:hypothetical protein [Candidatus Sodalis endolongispinus]MBT9431969.1 hypothetical protein [Candidatus Sodalis endolongispinus]